MRIEPIFAWYDIWVGAFWDKKKKWLYIFPLPTLGLILKFKWKCSSCKKSLDYEDVRFYTSDQPMCSPCKRSDDYFDDNYY